jgi:sarcosine oxidase subunit alpha
VTGVAAASRLSGAGLRVVLVDDGLVLGGALASVPHRAAAMFAESPLAGVEILERSMAAGVYDGELLLVGAAGEAILMRPRATLFATGAHDGALAVPGNDLPGIFSARALCRLVHAGIVPDGPAAVIGAGFWADELVSALGDAPILRFAPEAVIDVRGVGGVRAITVREGPHDGGSAPELPAEGSLATHAVAVVALALPGAPAFELCAQAGAEVRFDPAIGYAVITDDHGRAAAGVWAAGECTGKPFDPEALRAEGQRVAADLAAALGGGSDRRL